MRSYSLDDKYLLERGIVYMTGIQALVRVPIELTVRVRDADKREQLGGAPTGSRAVQPAMDGERL